VHAAFDGEGARIRGGRWNPEGTAVVYTSSTLALATLEALVHVKPHNFGDDLVAVAADIPERLGRSVIRLGDLRRDWQVHPPPGELADIGAEWLRQARTAVLIVPSAIIPQESNYLLSPRHPAFGRIKIQAPIPFRFDQRLWKTP